MHPSGSFDKLRTSTFEGLTVRLAHCKKLLALTPPRGTLGWGISEKSEMPAERFVVFAETLPNWK
jgi:hypothetical protein